MMAEGEACVKKKKTSVAFTANIERRSKCSTDTDDDNKIKCPYCPEITVQNKLWPHLREVHKVFPDARRYTKRRAKYSCNVCNKSYTVEKYWLEHYRKVHLKLRTLKEVKCPHCPEMVLKNRKHLHLDEAHDIKAPACGVCDKKFRNQEMVLQHTRRVHMKERNVVCKTCGFACFDMGMLKRHELSHSDIRQYECDVCGKKFRWKSNIITHVMIHTKDKRKKCAECGERFVQKASLNYHMTKHHPEVQF